MSAGSGHHAVSLSPRPWRRLLCERIASGLRMKMLSAASVRDKLVAIGDELAARGDLEGAAKQYAAAGQAARLDALGAGHGSAGGYGGNGSGPGGSGPSWIDLLQQDGG